MKAQIIKRFDEKGRIVIPRDLLGLLEIDGRCEVVICRCRKEGKVVVRKKDNLQDWEIIAISHVDCQGRLIIPSEIRQDTESAELYVKNGSLILKDAP